MLIKLCIYIRVETEGWLRVKISQIKSCRARSERGNSGSGNNTTLVLTHG